MVKLVMGLIETITALVLSLLNEQAGGALSWPFLVVLVFWLVALFVGALTVAGAIFLILEMNRPYSGFMQVSSTPISTRWRRSAADAARCSASGHRR